MTERPILFSGPMVRAILEGRKTQTRRVVKPQPDAGARITPIDSEWLLERWQKQDREFTNFGRAARVQCPYGKPGGRLWVRETLCRPDGDPWLYSADRQPVMVSREDETAMLVWAHHKEQDSCSSIFMPRWASRLTLEITDVRVERLRDITEEDAIAEGIIPKPGGVFEGSRDTSRKGLTLITPWLTAREAFSDIWDKINGKKHPWASNPWVWVIEFRPEAR